MQLIKAAKELLIRNPFYGLFLLNLRKEMVSGDHPVKTAAVGPNGVNFTLYVNEGFWFSLTDAQQLAVLQHEVMHICFFHLTDDFKASNHEMMNIAMDCSINQFIEGLPDDCVSLQGLSKKLNKQLEPVRGAWYYYKEMEEFSNNNPQPAFGNIDDHSMWPQDLTEAEKKLFENQIKAKIKETAETCQKQTGHVPGELAEILKRIKDKPPVFNWKKYFRRLVGNTITSELILTRMRVNKRFEGAKGPRQLRKPKILVGVDTSGSVSTKELGEFFSEIHHMYKTGTEITVIECDTHINNIFEYKGQQDIKIGGRGGTELEPIIEYYQQHKEYSTCILFTDGYCNTNMPICKNLIWVITSTGNKSSEYSPGYTIFIP